MLCETAEMKRTTCARTQIRHHTRCVGVKTKNGDESSEQANHLVKNSTDKGFLDSGDSFHRHVIFRSSDNLLPFFPPYLVATYAG